MQLNFYQRVYGLVEKIPRGKVSSYGQIAALLGNLRAARIVGWALHVMPEEDYRTIPWQRVLNSHGMISTTCREHPAELQAKLLAQEGIEVTERKDGTKWVDLGRYLWHPEVRSTKL